jgi:hypothetical protein
VAAGQTLQPTQFTTWHDLGPADNPGPTDDLDGGAAGLDAGLAPDLASVIEDGRDGAVHRRVRAVLTWHSAVEAWGCPRRWTAAKRKRNLSQPSELRLACRLTDHAGTVEATAFNSDASNLLGGTADELLAMDEAEFGNAAAAPLYRPVEWTLFASPSKTDDAVYLNIGAAVVADAVGRIE